MENINPWLLGIIGVLSSGGGLAGLVALLKGRSESHKTHAEGYKAEAETTKTGVDAQSVVIQDQQSWNKWLDERLKVCEKEREVFKKQLEKLQTEHSQIFDRIDKIENGHNSDISYGGTK